MPLQVLVDSDGAEKPAIQIILEEVASAGIDEAAIIITPADRESYADSLKSAAVKVHFIEQPKLMSIHNISPLLKTSFIAT